MQTKIGLSLPTYDFNTEHTALIIGAGLAGSSVAGALARRGYRCKIFDRNADIAAATSALPTAIIRPAVTGENHHAAFINEAFDVCCKELPKDLFHQCGLVQLANADSHHSFNDAQWLDAHAASIRAGTQLDSGAWYVEQAGWVHPARLCKHWLQHSAIEFHPNTHIAALRQTQYGWQLLSEHAEIIDESHLVILANAASAKEFDQTDHLPLSNIGGQLDYFEAQGDIPQTIISKNNYILPTGPSAEDLICCGATHHRDQPVAAITASDSGTNKISAKALAPKLQLPDTAKASFAGLRTATPDRLPIVGAAPDAIQHFLDFRDLKHGKPAHHFAPPRHHRGIYIAAGFGSRGATLATFVGEILSELISGNHNHASTLQLLHPSRFLIRDLRRGLNAPVIA